MKYGLLGKTLGHSYSPIIHNALGNNGYTLFERDPQDLKAFFEDPDLGGINITIPYKTEALRACHVVDDRAERIGCVNTMVRRNGRWHGYNTDYDGVIFAVNHADIDVTGTQCLVLGDGASSKTVHVALEDLNARDIIHISRHQYPTYSDIREFYDTAEIIINTTPVGMYPDCPESITRIAPFTKLKGIIDLIYNPRRSELLLQAEKLHIPHIDGLPVLIAQGVAAANHFFNNKFGDADMEQLIHDTRREKENIILIGMPGVGKTTVGRALAKTMHRQWIDTDRELIKIIGDLSEYITTHGEAAFREEESKIIRKLGKETSLVISTGGGCVTVPDNFPHLRQNGRLYYLTQPVEDLSIEGRVLSRGGIERLRKLEAIRRPMYRSFAQCTIRHHKNEVETIKRILEDFNTHAV